MSHDDRRFVPIFALWLISVSATLGSLFLGEVMRLPPCVLCWYQRICMYPLAVIATVGLLQRDTGVVRYAESGIRAEDVANLINAARAVAEFIIAARVGD